MGFGVLAGRCWYVSDWPCAWGIGGQSSSDLLIAKFMLCPRTAGDPVVN